MIDITPFLELRPAPRAVFDGLDERKDQPRFYAPGPGGQYTPVTWGAFARRIRNAALYLAEAGLRPGDRAAVFAPNSVNWAAAALAIQAAGGVMVPIYPASTADQVRYIVDHSDAKLVFVDTPELLARVTAPRIAMLSDVVDRDGVDTWSQVMATGAASARDFDAMLDAVELDQPGMMLYTSGTTGNPKGVPLTHRNTGINGRDWLECNAAVLQQDAVDVLWLPMSHIFGFGEMCLGNTLGFTTYLSDPYTVLQELPKLQPTVFMSVPVYWEKLAMAAMAESDPDARIAKLEQVTGGKLSFCLSGGAGLERRVKELFYSAGILIIEGYGLTECSPTLTLNRPDAFRFDTVGRPLPSVELRLADDGEILARGPNVFSGYHKDEAATREAFTDDGWFKTGDVGRFTDDGFLQIIDRKKDILVTAGGKNVPPANIEIAFRDDPYIEHVVVYGDGKKYLVAAVWPNHGMVVDALGASPSAGSVRGLIQHRIDIVNERLARHETIKKFALIDEPLTVEGGLLTASLKIRRKQIYARFGDRLEALYEAKEAAA